LNSRGLNICGGNSGRFSGGAGGGMMLTFSSPPSSKFLRAKGFVMMTDG